MRGAVVSLSVLAVLLCVHIPLLKQDSVTTLSFVTVSLALLYQAWAWLGMGSNGGVRPNALMWLMMVISYSLIFMALYIPPLRMALQTTPLTAAGWTAALLAASTSAVLAQIVSFLIARTPRHGSVEATRCT